MERYDAAIIGAGPDGLIAAHRLASAGLRVVVAEHRAEPGGPAITREFHRGFRASPYADEAAPIPAAIFRRMDLPRHGALLMPAPASTCVTEGRASVIYGDPQRMARLAGVSGGALVELHRELESVRDAISLRTEAVAPVARSLLPWRTPPRTPWPGEEWGAYSLAEAVYSRISDPALGLHVIAHVLSGASASPYLAGTGLHLLRGLGAGGLPRGGQASLSAAMRSAALAAGADIRLASEVTDIRVTKGKADGIVLSGGEEIASSAVISTLDLKNTFLSLLAWSDLEQTMARRIAQFRTAAARARVLFALDSLPDLRFAAEAPETALGPIHVVESLDGFAQSHDRWRAGILSDALPVTLRFPSLLDPSLAPIGKAVMTATVGSVPAKLFDGEWTAQKRDHIAKIALIAAEKLIPGLRHRLVGVKTIIADDVEAELHLTGGDLDGGELTPDQALGFRPFPEWQDGRTPVRALYLGGPSSAPAPFFTGGGGVLAAESLLTDHKVGRAR